MRRRRERSKKHHLRLAFRPLLWPLQGLALWLFWSCCAMLSPERAAACGAELARRLGPRLRRHQRFRANFAVALPHATEHQIERIARAAWASFGATLAEYAHFETIADRAFERHVEVILQPGVEAARARGRPFIFVTAHLGNWEISAATARHLGLPLTVIYSPLANPLAGWLLQRRRRSLGCAMVANGHAVRPLMRALRAGRSIGLLVDLRVENGDDVPFCGEDTTTTVVPARLALKFGCPLVPVRVERLRPAHLRVTLHDPVPADDGLAPDAQARRMMAQVNRLLESWIVERPHEWQYLQNRWPKSTRDRVARARTVRDVAAPVPAQAASGGVRSTSSSASWRT